MIERADILGVILAGGRSSRFGGGDKGLADLCGQSVIGHVLDRFKPQTGKVILSANGDQQRFSALGLTVLPDGEFPNQGPLSGLLAAFDYAVHAGDFSTVATVSADTPFLPLDLVSRMRTATSAEPVIATSAGRRHPTIGLWPVALRDELRTVLSQGRRGVDQFASRISAVEVEFAMVETGDCNIDPFFNINTAEDLEAARAMIRKNNGWKI